MTAARAALARWWTAPATPYIGAVALRTGARAVWGLALPTALSVAAYGRYQIIVTAAAMAAQLALLGIPQTVVRYTGRLLPSRLLVGHTLMLAALAIGAAAWLIPAIRTSAMVGSLALMVLGTIASTAFGARAKARFAFATSLRAEAAGAAVLLMATTLIVARVGRSAPSPAAVVVVEAIALVATAGLLLRARATPESLPHAGSAPSPSARAVFGDVYSVGTLVLLDVVLFRRLEVYFLERSPAGLAGVAVLGLSLQIAAVAMLVPTALLEAWQPRLSVVRGTGGDAAFEREVARRGKQFALLMLAVALLGTLVPMAAVPLLFPHYRPWLAYVVAFVLIRLTCAGAGFYSAALYAVGRHRVLYAPSIVSSIVAVSMNALFTLQMGLRGALIAYGITQVTVAALTVAAFRRGVPRHRIEVAPAPAMW